MKVYLYFVGKPRDAMLNGFAQEFVKRTTRFAPCEMREIDPAKFDLFAKHPSARKIFLDPAGKQLDSSAFSQIFARHEQVGRDLVFLVGGHDGLTADQRTRADQLLSLSPMTFPHELARAILAEQIYRAYTMLRNHPYPR
jgi:23S rRNA (pseudouridine1915-N3)-methyltransferase